MEFGKALESIVNDKKLEIISDTIKAEFPKTINSLLPYVRDKKSMAYFFKLLKEDFLVTSRRYEEEYFTEYPTARKDHIDNLIQIHKNNIKTMHMTKKDDLYYFDDKDLRAAARGPCSFKYEGMRTRFPESEGSED